MTTRDLPVVTFTDEAEARALMRLRNQTRRGRTEIAVVVDGPGDGEFTVMGLREAIENGFLYRWEI